METLDVSSFNTANVTDMDNMFEDCQKIKEFHLSHFRTPKVKYFRSMFNRCYAAETIDISNATTEGVYPGDGNSNPYAFNYMFNNCNNLKKLDMRKMVYPGRSTYAYIFFGCTNMKELHLDSFGDISTFAYVGYYHYMVGFPTSTGLADNSTPNDPCYIYTDNAQLIRQLMFNRSTTSGSNTYYNYAGNFRNNTVIPGKVVFRKTGFNNPWTINNLGNAAPALADIIAPTE